MNLSQFENDIDQKILERGYSYYENGCVASVEETSGNVYEAQVEGTELYTVEVELDDKDDILSSSCDCPYDMGEYCKHQVAVFLAIRGIRGDLSDENSNAAQNKADPEKVPKATTSRKRKASDIKGMLSERSKDELVRMLLDIASEYKEIRQRLEWIFEEGDEGNEIQKSIKLIRASIRSNSDRQGFVVYGKAGGAVSGAVMVLEKAQALYEKNEAIRALDLALCVIHEMIGLLDNADDSDGVIGDEIAESFALIHEITEDENIDPAEKESIFNRLEAEASNRRYDEWPDWRLELLEGCSRLVDSPISRKKLDRYLDSLAKGEEGVSWSSGYLAERASLIRYNMMERLDGPEKVQMFLEQNLRYSEFRKMAVGSAIERKDYNDAIKLMLDGEKNDESMPGLVDQWRTYRYKVYQLSGRLDEQRELAMEFILNGKKEYYDELKRTYTSDEWPSVCPKIVWLLENQKKAPWYVLRDVYTYILIEEGEKEKLLAYVKGYPAEIVSLYKELIPEYREDVCTLFVQHIEQSAAGAGDRKAYQRVCSIIRTLKRAGGKERAEEIKRKLLSQYAKRPAFQDELSKV